MIYLASYQTSVLVPTLGDTLHHRLYERIETISHVCCGLGEHVLFIGSSFTYFHQELVKKNSIALSTPAALIAVGVGKTWPLSTWAYMMHVCLFVWVCGFSSRLIPLCLMPLHIEIPHWRQQCIISCHIILTPGGGAIVGSQPQRVSISETLGRIFGHPVFQRAFMLLNKVAPKTKTLYKQNIFFSNCRNIIKYQFHKTLQLK